MCPNIPSAIRSIPHSDTVPIPVFHQEVQACEDDEMENYDFEYCGETSTPTIFSQGELSDLIRDLDLSKARAELLASRLKEKNCLAPGVKITFYRTRKQNLHFFFRMKIWYFS